MFLDPLDFKFLRFCRPVCAETEDPDYPFQRISSGFIVAFENQFYLFSARHAFKNLQADASRVAVIRTFDDNSRWPVLEFNLLEAVEQYSGDESYGDVAVFWLDPAEMHTSSLRPHDYLTVESSARTQIGSPLFVGGSRLYAFGFPDSFPDTGTNAYIDYESKLIYTDLVSIEGEYAGPSSEFGLHIFTSKRMGHNPTNGFSGGPITFFSQVGHHSLAGMILRGGGGSGIFRFLGIDLVADLLKNIALKFGRLHRNRNTSKGLTA